MSFKKIIQQSLLLTAIVFLGYFVYSRVSLTPDNQQVREAHLRESIKKELEVEFDQRIRNVVRAEVKKEVDLFLAKNPITDFQKQAKLSTPQTEPETIQAATRRIIQEILSREIQDANLDEYVAGAGITPELQLQDGFLKDLKPDFMLAAATKDKPAKKKKKKAKKEKSSQPGGQPAKERAQSLERTLAERGSILLPKGTLQIEPSITWAHFSSNRISIRGFSILPILVVGDISTETVKRDVFIQNFAIKYGLLNNFQTELKIPTRFEYDRITDTNNKESTRNTSGIGDIEVGVSRQIGWEHGLMPDLVASLNLKSRTGKSSYNRDIGLGTGHYAVRGSLVAAKSSDPAVIFGSVNYTYNFKRDIDNFGEIDPGNSIGYSLGTAIALSYQTAINFSFDHTVTFKTVKDGLTVAGSFLNTANFRTGFNWALNEHSSIDFAVALGITNDSPDVTVEVRFPYTF